MTTETRKITRIVMFYDDNTFTELAVRQEPAPYIPVPNPLVYPPGVRSPIMSPPNWQWPHVAPGTVTCKMADGTTQEIRLTSPIVAQNT